MRETWYVLEDGRKVDPNECSTTDAGALVHSSGAAVAMRAPGTPRSSGVDPAEERAKADASSKAKAETDAKAKAKAMKPEGEQSYKTRESKAD